jgi:L-seryl-tRNA(Ser) seleniumtransferase
MPAERLIPSIDTLLQRPALVRLAATHGRDNVTDAARRAAATLRALLSSNSRDAPSTEAAAADWLAARVDEELSGRLALSLGRVINATGVLLHTNLGRAPLAPEALQHAARIAAGYSNLEYDVSTGTRGSRRVHAERLLCQLTGAEAAFVVNNNAAATLVVLAALAGGREVIVSRGELVEIGGGFRVPDVMAQSGAALREVGTTNRTRAADYAAAIGPRTAMLLRVHPSNFRVEGFTERPGLDELVALAQSFSIPLFEDLGSGWLGVTDTTPAPLRDEPSVRASLRAGADLVAFSGDKLLGGPQAGIVVGRRELIDRASRHPLVRAVRADKLTYAALESTLALWSQPAERQRIPIYRMLTASSDQVDRRARALADRLSGVPGVTCRIVDGAATTGGGSAPASQLPTRLIALAIANVSAPVLDARLRAGNPPVIARISDDRVHLDVRTIQEDDEADVIAAVTRAAGRS